MMQDSERVTERLLDAGIRSLRAGGNGTRNRDSRFHYKSIEPRTVLGLIIEEDNPSSADIIKCLKKLDTDDVLLRDGSTGNSLMHHALMSGDVAILEALLKGDKSLGRGHTHQKDIESLFGVLNDNRLTPIHYLLVNGSADTHRGVFEYLLRNYKDQLIQDRNSLVGGRGAFSAKPENLALIEELMKAPSSSVESPRGDGKKCIIM